MKKKIITLTPAEMTTLLIIYGESNRGFWPKLNEKLDYISESYPKNEFPIPDDCEEKFQISIPVEEGQNFLLTIQSALENNALDGYWDEITTFSARMETLITEAEEVEMTRAMCILLGNVKLSDTLIKKLTDQKVDIFQIKIGSKRQRLANKAQRIVAVAMATDEDIEALVIIIVAGDVKPRIIEECLETFDDFAAEDIFVYQFVPDGFSVACSAVDVRIAHENQIEWGNDIHITLPPDEEPVD